VQEDQGGVVRAIQGWKRGAIPRGAVIWKS
jgi:hypothetical protein